MGWKVSSPLAAALLVVLAMAHPATSPAQAQATASIHGHVNNAIGQLIQKGEVKLTTDRSAGEKSRKYQYTFPIDNGEYKGTGIAPGNYVVIVYQEGKSLDFNESVVVALSLLKTVND